MPILDGLETTKRLRRLESESMLLSDADIENHSQNSSLRQSNNIIIGVSGISDDQTKTEALSAGMNAFLVKPLVLETFFDELCNIITKNMLK